MPCRVVCPAGRGQTGTACTLTLTVAELFDGCGSATPDVALPVFAYVPAVCGARTAMLIVAWPDLSSVPSGQATSGAPPLSTALHELSAPATDAPTKVVPAGSWSVNVAPVASCGPEFLTWKM